MPVVTEEQSAAVGATEVVAAVMNRRAFHCLRCGVYASQDWKALSYFVNGARQPAGVTRGSCLNCKALTFWLAHGASDSANEYPDAILMWPKDATSAPRHHEDMPADVAADYDEARDIVERSPRGATALLRLAVQKLMADLGQPGKNINADIAALVQAGLPVEIQQALDALRVIGNNAVHPGELDLKDDRETSVALFGLLNFIVDQRITQPKRLAALYSKLPAGAVAAIKKRDTAPEA